MSKVSDTLTFTQDGKEITIVMYSGVLNKLTKIIGDLTDIGNIYGDPDKGEEVLKIVLAKYDENGVSTELHCPIFSLSIENKELILNWVLDNVVNFITAAALKLNAAMVKFNHETQTKASNPTTTG